MKRMFKKKHLIIYGIGMCLFCIWLICSSMLMAWFFHAEIPRKIDFSKIEEKDNVEFWIDIDNATNASVDAYGYGGWAFVETDEDNTNRRVSLIFCGEGKCYEVLANSTVYRGDIVAKYPEKKIPSSNIGFNLNMSTLNIGDGIYDLYLYCWENEKNYGLADTGYQVVKKGAEFTRISRRAEESHEKWSVLQKEYSVRYIDEISIIDNWIDICGWAFVEDMNSDDQIVYLEFSSDQGIKKQYRTHSLRRFSIAETFQDNRYTNSGFLMSLPTDSLEDGNWKVDIFIENEGRVWTCYPYALIKKDSQIMFYSYEWGGEEVVNLLTPSKTEKNTLCIDVIGLEDNNLKISGWVFVEGQDCSTQNVYIELRSDSQEIKQYTARSLARDGVVEKYKSNLYLNSGYLLLLPNDTFQNGIWEMRVLVENNHEIWASEFYTIAKVGENIVWYPGKSMQVETEVYPVTVNMEQNDSYLDQAIIDNGWLYISGWAFSDGEDSSLQKAYLQFENEQGQVMQYAVPSTVRTDVARAYGNELYTVSGYSFSCPSKDFGDGTWKMCVLLETDAGLSRSSLYTIVKNEDIIRYYTE